MSLSEQDIDFISGTIKVFGKGKKERIVPIGDTAIKSIRSYLAKRKKQNAALFLNKNGSRISAKGVRHIVGT